MATIPSWLAGHGGGPHSSRVFPNREQSPRAAQAPDSNEAEPIVETRPMPWSWHVAKIAGIDVYIHATFLILIAWLLILHAGRGSTLVQTFEGIAFVLVLFLCVVLHEFGHALMARRYGIHTRDITLLPIGGVARLERIPREPLHELAVALAGPAVNVVIAGILLLILMLSGQPLTGFDSELIGTGSNPIADLMSINLTLALFNLLPAFPMDGGRVLRALLALKLPRVKATRVASVLGQGMAILFGIVGLMGQPFLMFIALFIFMGATQEYRMIRFESAVEGLTVRSAMMTSFRTLIASDPLSRAVTLLLQGSQHDFPVLDENLNVIGFLLRQDLIAALSKDGGSSMPIASAMRKVEASATPGEPLESVFQRMQSSQLPVMPIFESDGKLAGLLTMENVAEIVMVKSALDKAEAEHKTKAVS